MLSRVCYIHIYMLKSSERGPNSPGGLDTAYLEITGYKIDCSPPPPPGPPPACPSREWLRGPNQTSAQFHTTIAPTTLGPPPTPSSPSSSNNTYVPLWFNFSIVIKVIFLIFFISRLMEKWCFAKINLKLDETLVFDDKSSVSSPSKIATSLKSTESNCDTCAKKWNF